MTHTQFFGSFLLLFARRPKTDTTIIFLLPIETEKSWKKTVFAVVLHFTFSSFEFFLQAMCPEFAISRKSGSVCPFPFFAPRYLQIARSAKKLKKWRFLNFWNFYVVIFKYLTKYSKDEKILKNAIKFLIFFGWRFFLRFLG